MDNTIESLGRVGVIVKEFKSLKTREILEVDVIYTRLHFSNHL